MLVVYDSVTYCHYVHYELGQYFRTVVTGALLSRNC